MTNLLNRLEEETIILEYVISCFDKTRWNFQNASWGDKTKLYRNWEFISPFNLGKKTLNVVYYTGTSVIISYAGTLKEFNLCNPDFQNELDCFLKEAKIYDDN
jgi:hypothetical protein